MITAGEERSLAVNGYSLAALEWNPAGRRKVIALHGWMDNAASFIHLSPRLDDCHILALDLAGHGCSDHRPPQATYNLWDDLLDILAAADSQGWQQFHLLGHSRGAMVSLLLAAAMPERIASLVLIDGLVPGPVEVADTAAQLGQFLRDSRRPARAHAGYPSIEKAVQLRCKAIGMLPDCARPIVERGLRQQGDSYHWRSDPRLRNASAVKMTDAHNRALLASLKAPLLLTVADRGMGAWPYFKVLSEAFPALRPQVFKGSHHFHLESAQVGALSECIGGFYGAL